MHKFPCFIFPPDAVLIAQKLDEAILFSRDRHIRESKIRAKLENSIMETDKQHMRKRPWVLLELSVLMAGLPWRQFLFPSTCQPLRGVQKYHHRS